MRGTCWIVCVWGGLVSKIIWEFWIICCLLQSLLKIVGSRHDSRANCSGRRPSYLCGCRGTDDGFVSEAEEELLIVYFGYVLYYDDGWTCQK